MALPLKRNIAKMPDVSIPTRSFQPKNYTPILVVLLLIASFFFGMLADKVNLFQGGDITPTIAGQQPQQPAGKKFDNNTGPYPSLGKKDAKVTIVEFADFQCPFCEKFYTDVEKSIIKDYVNTGKAKFAFRDYAFLGQESTYAAQAARCANDQNKFWEFHNYLYEHQSGENQGAFAKDKLEGFAEAINLDTQKFNQCLESDKYANAVADETRAGQEFGVSGTPATFINGQMIIGAQPYDVFKQAIDAALK